MKFITKIACIYSKHKPVFSATGSPVIDRYSSRYSDDGTVEVYVSGQRDFQAYIESFRDSCDLNKMVAKYMAGDETALDRVHGMYLDVREFPTSYAEMFNMVNEAKDKFEHLDPAIKEKFNNNPVEFFMQYGSEQFNEKIKSVFPDHDDIIPKDVDNKDEVNKDADK